MNEAIFIWLLSILVGLICFYLLFNGGNKKSLDDLKKYHEGTRLLNKALFLDLAARQNKLVNRNRWTKENIFKP